VWFGVLAGDARMGYTESDIIWSSGRLVAVRARSLAPLEEARGFGMTH